MNAGTFNPKIWGAGVGEGVLVPLPVGVGVGVRVPVTVPLTVGVGDALAARGESLGKALEETEGEGDEEEEALDVVTAEAVAEEEEVEVAEAEAVEEEVEVVELDPVAVGVMEKLFEAGRIVYWTRPRCPSSQGGEAAPPATLVWGVVDGAAALKGTATITFPPLPPPPHRFCVLAEVLNPAPPSALRTNEPRALPSFTSSKEEKARITPPPLPPPPEG